MSSLWTPSGEHQPRDEGPEPTGDAPGVAEAGREPTESERAAMEAELRRVRAELASTPVADVVANHAIGLWQLAVLHLSPEEGEPVRLDEAGLAVDAMATLVEGLGDRLGEAAGPLRDALAQLRVAFVQVSERATSTGDAGSEAT